ncbi:hypothetical protein BH23BAC1_BH23BAC1_19440 [soil metagenome]
MKIFTDPTREDFYQTEYPGETLRVYFLLRQIDVLDKNSLIYQNVNIYSMVPLPLKEEMEILIRTRSLLKELKIEINYKLKVYPNLKNSRFFVIANGDKIIEVDTEIPGIKDKSSSLFWKVNYNLKKPELIYNNNKIEKYKEIYQKLTLMINSFESV